MRPSPDYGTLGPTSDVVNLAASASGLLTPASTVSSVSASSRQRQQSLCRLCVFAAIAGAAVALAFSSVRISGAHLKNLASPPAAQMPSSVSSGMLSDGELERQRPQKQAEILLERAVSRSGGDASEGQAEGAAQIEARLDAWRGKLKWDAELGELTTVALNSSDYSVRTSAIEVQLAAYGLTKSESSVDTLVRQADSSDHAQKDWALWALGLLGNRGIETDRVVRVLTAHLKDSGKNSASDSDEETRRWAVEGLALVGNDFNHRPTAQCHAQRSVADSSRTGRVQSRRIRYVDASAAPGRSTATDQLLRRPIARCSDPLLGIPGARPKSPNNISPTTPQRGEKQWPEASEAGIRG
jgi:hypothetical protein